MRGSPQRARLNLAYLVGVDTYQPLPQQGTPHPRESRALMALTWGLVTGPIGLLMGWRLTATSTLWSVRQKIVASLAVPLPLLVGAGIIIHTVWTFRMEDDSGYAPPWEVALVWTGFLSLFIVPVGLTVYLSRAANKGRPVAGQSVGVPLRTA